jgi:hypothetical protein
MFACIFQIRNLFVILLSLLLLAGCSPVEKVEIFDRNKTKLVETNNLQSPGFQTATPPSNPDLRGVRFQVIIFVAESGPFASLANSIRVSVSDGVENINSHGGVNGAHIDLKVVSIPDDPEMALEIILEKLEELAPVVVLMASPVDDTMYYEINHQDVPFLYFGLGGMNFTSPENRIGNLFWLIPSPDKQISFFVTSLWENWDEVRPVGAYNELGIGYLEEKGQETDASVDETLTRLDFDNFEILVRGVVSSRPNGSVTNFLLDSVQRGATVLYSSASPPGTAVLLNDLGSLAIVDSFVYGGAVWSISSQMDEFLISQMNLDGYVLPFPSAWWSESDNLAIQSAEIIFSDADHLEGKKDLAYLIGLGGVDLVRELLSRSVADLGAGEVEADDIYSELVRMNDYEVMGGLFKVDYSGGNRSPSQMQLWQLNNGEWLPVGEGKQAP